MELREPWWHSTLLMSCDFKVLVTWVKVTSLPFPLSFFLCLPSLSSFPSPAFFPLSLPSCHVLFPVPKKGESPGGTYVKNSKGGWEYKLFSLAWLWPREGWRRETYINRSMCKEPRKSRRLECLVVPSLVRIMHGGERMKAGQKGGKVFWGRGGERKLREKEAGVWVRMVGRACLSACLPDVLAICGCWSWGRSNVDGKESSFPLKEFDFVENIYIF